MTSPDPRWWKDKRVLVTGADGFVGQRVVTLLTELGLAQPARIRPFGLPEGDLRSASNARWAVGGCDVVLHLAADVGGLSYSSTHSADQYYNCSAMDLAVIEAARQEGVSRVVVLGCSTAYPAASPSPLAEHMMFDGPPRDSHLGYGLAKRNGLVMTSLYARQHGMPISAIVSNNIYGPGDHFDETAHVVAALVRKCCSGGVELEVWGDGTPVRDFVYVDDVAVGLLLAAEHLPPGEFVNVGSGSETTIAALVETVVAQSGFGGRVRFDRDKPNGEPRRSLDIAKARAMGYEPRTPLAAGIQNTIDWYRQHEMGGPKSGPSGGR